MSRVICHALCLGSTVLSVVLVLANSTLGTDLSISRTTAYENDTVTEQYTPYLEKSHQYIPNSVTRVTSVSQLSDIKTTDWNFQALKSLMERYGVVANDFDHLFLGNQSITRYEFSTLLNATINHLNELISKENTNLISKKDLATIKRLQSEFSPELATWQRRIDNVKVKTNQLAAQQFSPTAKFTGEVIFALSGVNDGKKANDDDEEVDENLILTDRVWLNFDISFTGRDRLFLRLEAENTPSLDDATGTEMTRLGFYGDSDNKFDINQLEYRFFISEAARLYITSDSSDIQRVANTVSSFSASGRGAISRFGRYSPLYRLDFGAAIRLKYEISNIASLSLGLADDDADDEDDAESSLEGDTDGAVVQLTLEPTDDVDIFLAYQRDRNKYGAIAQLIVEPIDDVELGLTYVRFYDNLDTGTGSELANDPFDDESDYITTSSYGIEASIEIGSDFTIGGWAGLTQARATDLAGEPEASIFHYAVTLAFLDLGKEGSLGGIVIGQPPKAISNEFDNKYTDKDTSLHLEFFYRFQATDNIAITPGFFIVTNPEHNQNNDTIYVGTVRTTFRF